MNTSLSSSTRAHLLLGAMSLADKVRMVHGGSSNTDSRGAAGYVPSNPKLCIPELVLQDAGAGLGDGQKNTTAFPAPIAQAATWDPSLQKRFGQELGSEAWQKGVNVMLAPDVNVDRVPLDGRNYESLGEDPFLAGQTAVAEIDGIQSNPVIATVKHFAAYSEQTHESSTSANVSMRTLEEIYLPPFAAAVTQGHVGAVMCSYNLINDVHACQDPGTLTRVLRNQWGFQGFVVSDWILAVHSTVQSATAGLDLEMPDGTFFGKPLRTAVETGQVPMARLNQMVLDILTPMFRIGLFDHVPAEGPQLQGLNVSTPADNQTALTLAEDGTVLLKNAGNVLPLAKPSKAIAVIGRVASHEGADGAYGGGGSSHVPAYGLAHVVPPLSAIRQMGAKRHDSVVYNDGSDIASAVAAAKSASVAVVFADDAEGETQDEPSLNLRAGACTFVCAYTSEDQDALIAAVARANPHTIVVLDSGGPVLMPWISQVKGIVEAWYPGQQDGNAIAAILFGSVDPSGKLPETFPASESQLPTNTVAQFPGVNNQEAYSEGLLIGYRWYDEKHIAPLFPFGYGLSYTTFSLSDLSVRRGSSGAQLTFTVRDTGKRVGSEVAQVYVGDPPSTGEPPEQLEGYQKVLLKPGQSKRVTVAVSQHAFAYWNAAANGWRVAPGCYSLMVGTSSADLPLQAQVAQGGGSCHGERPNQRSSKDSMEPPRGQSAGD
jgi:beta-glucosidase